MNQTKMGSLIEALVNILIGYWINFVGNMLILPLFGFNVTLAQNLQIGLLFTVISVARSYLLRRFFNHRLHQAAERLSRRMSQ